MLSFQNWLAQGSNCLKIATGKKLPTPGSSTEQGTGPPPAKSGRGTEEYRDLHLQGLRLSTQEYRGVPGPSTDWHQDLHLQGPGPSTETPTETRSVNGIRSQGGVQWKARA